MMVKWNGQALAVEQWTVEFAIFLGSGGLRVGCAVDLGGQVVRAVWPLSGEWLDWTGRDIFWRLAMLLKMHVLDDALDAQGEEAWEVFGQIWLQASQEFMARGDLTR